MNNLEIKHTNIKGLLEINIPVAYDERGYFKENWQREKMVALGLPDFVPVQHNISFNENACGISVLYFRREIKDVVDVS